MDKKSKKALFELAGRCLENFMFSHDNHWPEEEKLTGYRMSTMWDVFEVTGLKEEFKNSPEYKMYENWSNK